MALHRSITIGLLADIGVRAALFARGDMDTEIDFFWRGANRAFSRGKYDRVAQKREGSARLEKRR